MIKLQNSLGVNSNGYWKYLASMTQNLLLRIHSQTWYVRGYIRQLFMQPFFHGVNSWANTNLMHITQCRRHEHTEGQEVLKIVHNPIKNYGLANYSYIGSRDCLTLHHWVWLHEWWFEYSVMFKHDWSNHHLSGFIPSFEGFHPFVIAPSRWSLLQFEHSTNSLWRHYAWNHGVWVFFWQSCFLPQQGSLWSW